jgi:putative transposase
MPCPNRSNEMKPLPQRHSIRLPDFDYTQNGVYFITICSHQKAHIFGEIIDGKMKLNRIGQIAQQCLLEIPIHFKNSELLVSVVMPNHIHVLIGIMNDNETGTTCRAPTGKTRRSFSRPISGSVSTIIGSFKASVTKIINRESENKRKAIWQRGFYEHIIRNENDLKLTANYIMLNPENWERDSEY